MLIEQTKNIFGVEMTWFAWVHVCFGIFGMLVLFGAERIQTYV